MIATSNIAGTSGALNRQWSVRSEPRPVMQASQRQISFQTGGNRIGIPNQTFSALSLTSSANELAFYLFFLKVKKVIYRAVTKCCAGRVTQVKPVAGLQLIIQVSGL